MEFSQVKKGDVYYVVTEGQFIGVFYIIKKSSNGGKMLASYYGGDVIIDYFDYLDFDWQFELEEDEDLPDRHWLANAQHIKRFRHQDIISEHLQYMLKAIFDRELIFKV